MLPDRVAALHPPLFEALPLDEAMGGLLTKRTNFKVAPIAGEAVCQLAVAKDPMLAAGIWLYVDDLEAAHQLVQYDSSATASWWHAVVHRREGDFGNSRYWYRQSEGHPGMPGLGFEPERLVRAAETNDESGIPLQKQEWVCLMRLLTGS